MKRSILYALAFVGIVFSSCNSNNNKLANHHQHLHTGHTHTHHKNEVDYFGEYTIENEEFGTKTSVTISGGKRIIKTNALPNHETGKFPTRGNPNRISAQDRTYKILLNPIHTRKPK